MSQKQTTFVESLKIYLEPTSLKIFFLGFSSGLPLLLVLGTLSFWLRESGVDLSTIGFFSWVGLIYGVKWTWAPLIDRIPLPVLGRLLGRRRSWLLASQVGLIASVCLMACTNPQTNLQQMLIASMLVAFFSASQDIALDAFRIESAQKEKQAALAAMYQAGYRIAMIWAGAGTLALAAFYSSSPEYLFESWTFAYLIMAGSLLLGICTTLLAKEPTLSNQTTQTVITHMTLQQKIEVLIDPIKDFFRRYGRTAIVILALVATYRISDVVMGVMANPFYLDLGFSKQEIAAVSKVFGVLMTLAGAFIGGIVTLRLGLFKTLFLGALMACSTNVLFSVLAHVGYNLNFLIFTVSADNLAAGLASGAFVAYLSSLTNSAYCATQYALFSSIMLVLPKFLAGFSGLLVEKIGYSHFFLVTAAIGLPVLVLIVWSNRLQK